MRRICLILTLLVCPISLTADDNLMVDDNVWSLKAVQSSFQWVSKAVLSTPPEDLSAHRNQTLEQLFEGDFSIHGLWIKPTDEGHLYVFSLQKESKFYALAFECDLTTERCEASAEKWEVKILRPLPRFARFRAAPMTYDFPYFMKTIEGRLEILKKQLAKEDLVFDFSAIQDFKLWQDGQNIAAPIFYLEEEKKETMLFKGYCHYHVEEEEEGFGCHPAELPSYLEPCFSQVKAQE